jgi:hypothetical protein
MHSSADAPHLRKRRLVPAILLTVVVGVMAFTAVIFLGVGRWLVVEDPLDKAQIVVLSGRIPMRAKEAARLYNAAYAPQVWLTRASEPAAALQEMHIPYLGEDFFNSRVLIHERVPSNAIRVIEPPIDSPGNCSGIGPREWNCGYSCDHEGTHAASAHPVERACGRARASDCARRFH